MVGHWVSSIKKKKRRNRKEQDSEGVRRSGQDVKMMLWLCEAVTYCRMAGDNTTLEEREDKVST